MITYMPKEKVKNIPKLILSLLLINFSFKINALDILFTVKKVFTEFKV